MDQSQAQIKLEAIIGGVFPEARPNVYFSPPSSINVKHPCIIFELADVDTGYADNTPYVVHKKYTCKYVSRTYDEEIIDIIIKKPNMVMDRQFVANGYNHTVFTIF